MKRLVSLLFVPFLFLASTTASAAEFKATGFWDMSFVWADTLFSRDNTSDRFTATQRQRTQIQMIVSESLRGVLHLEMNSVWGETATGGSLGTDGTTVKVKSSFVDWMIPETGIKVRMGLQPVTLPGFVAGSNIFDDDIAGITLSKQFTDNVGLTLAWGRAFNDNNPVGIKEHHAKDTADSFSLVVPLTFDSFKIIPWATYAIAGRESDPFRIVKDGDIISYGAPQLLPAVWGKDVNWAEGRDVNVIWAGLTGEATTWDPLRLAFDFNYGNISGVSSELDRRGYFLSGLAEYSLERMTPGIMLWYASGDDGDINNGSERMPTFSAQWLGTSMGWNGYYSSRGDGASVVGLDSTGTWGVSLYLKDMSWLEDLSHTLRVAWYQGTNDPEMAEYISGALSHGFENIGYRTWNNYRVGGLYLTRNDNVWEVNVDSVYKIMENLDFSLELGYMRLSLDTEKWAADNLKRDAYRVDATLRYRF